MCKGKKESYATFVSAQLFAALSECSARSFGAREERARSRRKPSRVPKPAEAHRALDASDAIITFAAEQTTSADQAVVVLALSLARLCELRGIAPSQAFDAAVLCSRHANDTLLSGDALAGGSA